MSLLRLPGWQTVEVIDKPKAYRITATYSVELSACPQDGGPLYRHGTLQKLFRDLPIHGKRVSILAIRQRYRCRACGKTFQQPVTGIHDGRKMTERLVLHIQEEAQRRPFAAVAHEAGVDEKTVRAIFDEHTTAALHRLRPPTPRVLGIDEVHLRRRSRCVFTNIEEATILDMLPSWSYHSVYQFLVTHLKDRSAVEIVCLDMHQPYRLAVKAALPEAVLVVDKWPVLRMACQAVDAVRLALRPQAERSPAEPPAPARAPHVPERVGPDESGGLAERVVTAQGGLLAQGGVLRGLRGAQPAGGHGTF